MLESLWHRVSTQRAWFWGTTPAGLAFYGRQAPGQLCRAVACGQGHGQEAVGVRTEPCRPSSASPGFALHLPSLRSLLPWPPCPRERRWAVSQDPLPFSHFCRFKMLWPGLRTPLGAELSACTRAQRSSALGPSIPAPSGVLCSYLGVPGFLFISPSLPAPMGLCSRVGCWVTPLDHRPDISAFASLCQAGTSPGNRFSLHNR